MATSLAEEDALAADTAEAPEVAYPAPTSPLAFDPYLTCQHPVALAATDALIAYSAHHHLPTLSRKPKTEHQANFETITRTLVANLTLAVVQGVEPPAVGITLRSARQPLTRYDRKGFTAMPGIIERLLGHGTFTLTRSRQRGHSSTLTPSPAFVQAIEQATWQGDEFGEDAGAEAILLTASVRDFKGDIRSRLRIDYVETAETTRLREEMAIINGLIAGARLEVADGGPQVFTGRRHLARHFKTSVDDLEERFDAGGRMFSGWWQRIAKERRRHILIDGEATAEADYASMALRLAYVRAGLEPPPGDLYATIPGGLGEARWRPGVKLVTLALLSRDTPLQRLPRGSVELLPKGTTGPGIRRAILAAHPALEAVFERGLGLELQFMESQILTATLLELAKSGTVALPIHDGLVIARSKADLAAQAMREAAKAVCGRYLPVVVKETVY